MILLSMLLAFASANAADIPPDSKVIDQLSSGASAPGQLPAELRLLNWNIEKGEQGEPWVKDMPAFAADRNVVLLQEGWQSPAVLSTLRSLNGLSFYMAGSFVWKGAMTGVIAGFSNAPDSLAFRRSPQNEPILGSPKMTLISRFHTTEGRELVIVDVHGINFVGPDKLKNQLDEVVNALASYDGALIVAGDFNTWNDARSAVVAEFGKKLGLTEIAFTRTGTNPVLDHVFQRGCAVEKSWVVEHVTSSDHDPEFVNLNCKENP